MSLLGGLGSADDTKAVMKLTDPATGTTYQFDWVSRQQVTVPQGQCGPFTASHRSHLLSTGLCRAL